MKRIFATMLTVIMMITLVTPALATVTTFNNPGNALPEYLRQYSDAYIRYSEQLAINGLSAAISIQEFANIYSNNYDTTSLIDYANLLVSREILDASMVTMRSDSINDDYSEFDNDETSGTYSVGGKWYDNIGNSTSSISIGSKPYYSTHNLLITLAPGDIIYETTGGVAAITGHVAIVQGIYWSSQYNDYYIRTIEAAGSGVVFGVIDDTRYDDRGASAYYINGATSTHISNALSFCVDQLGKPYNMSGALGGASNTYCNVSRGSSNWYCSELIWAAYFNEGNGININGTTIPKNLYSPYMVANCDRAIYIPVP